MSDITIKVFHVLDEHRELVRTVHVKSNSGKALTGARALKALRREFPEIGYLHSLLKTADGWLCMKTIEPKETCEFHYKWAHYLVSSERAEIYK